MAVAATAGEGVSGWRRRPVSSDRANAIYYATYTAFDGSQVAPHLLETSDFRTFTISQLSGPSARNKGMALFPRRIAGRYAALSRWDRKSNAVAYSDDAHDWSEARTVQSPTRPWALIQLGNCGSPIETPTGWLVFTHGVGPMREYATGVVLLDLDEPERLIAALPEPPWWPVSRSARVTSRTSCIPVAP